MKGMQASILTSSTGQEARARLLAELPVSERRLELAGISTAVLEAGNGRPVVLLHGPGANATHWSRVIPCLVASRRVIAPDLPGQGASEYAEPLDAQRTIDWLAELISRTCAEPPLLVGYALGAAIAARYAARRSQEIAGLVLVDALGLVPFRPAPEFGAALNAFITNPSETTHDLLWQRCTFELDPVRSALGDTWDAFRTYNVERGSNPLVAARLGELFELLVLPAIPSDELRGISVPTSLIWGKHDPATPVTVAQASSDQYGWELHTLECGGDPPMEMPEALARILVR